MRTSSLLVASSFIALTASAAGAQVTTVGSNRTEIFNDGADNKAQVENTAEGNDRNNAVVVFNGNGNRTTISQVGDDNGAKTAQHSNSNSSSVRQLGLRNSATLIQVGNGNGSNIDQYLDPRIGLYGDRIAVVEQWGDGNSSSVVQVNENNVARVTQGDGTGRSHGAVSTIYQYSSGNSATVRMFGGSPDAANRSHIEQTRIDPVLTNSEATVDINGSFNLSYLYQVGARNVGQHTVTGTQNTIIGKSYGNSLQSSVVQQGFRNFATVNQFAGDRNSSRIEQIDGGDRQVYVSQGGSDNSSTVIQRSTTNAVVVSQSGAGTVSSIEQDATGNFARANLFEGSAGALNKSTITQRHGNLTTHARHVADVTLRGSGNESSVSQSHVRHLASVEVGGGGAGLDEAGRRRGNSVTIVQDRALSILPSYVGEAGHAARVQVGLLAGGGVGTVTAIEQHGQHSTHGNEATVRQEGQYDRVTIAQSMRFQAVEGGAIANVATRGILNQVNITQFGRQFATVTQGFGRESTIGVTQYDSAGSRQFAQPSLGENARGNNSLNASQNGDRNGISVGQEGTGNAVTVWQTPGSSDNSIFVNQGRNSFAPVDGFNCITRCQFAGNATSSVTQSGQFNTAEINQYFDRGRAAIDQHGTGTGTLRNVARITQMGSAEATILQTAGVGPSEAGDPASGALGDPSYFAGGARASEARIRQGYSAGSARIEQRGRGQYAFIDQGGANGANTASILQEAGATNATAIIVQSGSGNSYSVVQDRPGQYISVSQTGSNNDVTNVIRRGPGS